MKVLGRELQQEMKTPAIFKQLEVSRMEKARLRLEFHHRLELEQIWQGETKGEGVYLFTAEFLSILSPAVRHRILS